MVERPLACLRVGRVPAENAPIAALGGNPRLRWICPRHPAEDRKRDYVWGVQLYTCVPREIR